MEEVTIPCCVCIICQYWLTKDESYQWNELCLYQLSIDTQDWVRYSREIRQWYNNFTNEKKQIDDVRINKTIGILFVKRIVTRIVVNANLYSIQNTISFNTPLIHLLCLHHLRHHRWTNTWESLTSFPLLLAPKKLLLVLRYRMAHAESFVKLIDTEPAKNQMIGRVPQDRF